jgi:undecaprenyl-diphosphatase
MRAQIVATGLLCTFISLTANAGGGPLGIDHAWHTDESGIYSRNVQNAVVYGLIGAEVAGALWEGGDTRLGKTFWYSIDSSLLAGISAGALKRVTGRVRPRDEDNPNAWFKGSHNQSFPSGEVTAVTSIITPFVLEYRHDYPMVYALELIPIYDAVARMKSRAHWQTDVIAAYALGTAAGFIAHSREQPFVLSVLPDGMTVGFSKKF